MRWCCPQSALPETDKIRPAFRVSQFRAGVLGMLSHGPRKDGRVALAVAAGLAGPREPSDWLARRAYAALALVPCLPDSIDVCLAVWEQFWCNRAGLFCGSLAFHRVRRRLVRRGPPRGKTYAYPEGHPRWLTASKRVNPSPDPCIEGGGASVEVII